VVVIVVIIIIVIIMIIIINHYHYYYYTSIMHGIEKHIPQCLDQGLSEQCLAIASGYALRYKQTALFTELTVCF